jgi:membrane-associated phospholipid phosphatase
MHVGGNLPLLGAGVLVALVVVAALRAWRPFAAGVVALVVASLLTTALKDVVQRPRPAGALTLFDPGGYAFPSGHAARTAALCVAVLVTLRLATGGVRRLAVGLVVLMNVVLGVLLVYLGTHWPTDVFAGWVLGAAIGWLVAQLALRVVPLRRGEASVQLERWHEQGRAGRQAE